MKKLDNIVVESTSIHRGAIIISTFNELGIDTGHKVGYSDFHPYYGLYQGKFDNFNKEKVTELNLKLITLEQLKAMKEDKSEYPKLMWVWNGSRGKKYKRVVFMEKNNNFIAWERADSIDGAKEVLDTHPWDYAQDIEEAPDPKQEEKTKVEFTGTLCMGDFQKNTMTFEIEGDMTLQAGRYLISKID